VIVNAKNIETKIASKKLDNKLEDQFEIEKLCGTNAYRLKLAPLSGKIHPVFHVSLLEPYRHNTIPGRRSPIPQPVDLEQPEYVIEKIKTMEIKGAQVKYLVSCKGCGLDEDIWEPYENLKDGGEHVVRQFHLDNPRQLRDPEVSVGRILIISYINYKVFGMISYAFILFCLSHKTCPMGEKRRA